jgi:uncharacterized protein (TIGR01777 family)
MRKLSYQRSVTVPVTARRLWDWHTANGAFERLAPAWQRLVPVDLPDSIAEGSRAEFYLKSGPLKLRWVARLGPVEPPYRFIDTQERGPFACWQHEHLIGSDATGEAILTDRISYALPLGLGSIPLFRTLAHNELDRLFAFRHRRMLEDLRRFPETTPGKGKTVLISGSSGLIGRRLAPYLRTLGYTVRGLTRGRTGTGMFRWDPGSGWVDPEALEGVDAVIHLAGEGIAGGRWTPARKKRILESRIDGTNTIVKAMAGMSTPPTVFISASGVNYYEMGAGPHSEDGSRGGGFLAEVCEKWEAEAMKANGAGIRVVCLRTGVVLDPLGGALGKMLPAFRLGLGGPIGSGRQGFPWIGMDDLLDVYERALCLPGLAGPVNAVHPEALDQGSFSKVLGLVLRRPAIIPLPAAVVKLLFGQMGTETLLADLSVRPTKLLESGFQFRHSGLRETLSLMLGRQS